MTDAPESSVGIGVLGGNAFIANAAVLPALAAARGAHLSAIASRSGEVPSRWADRAVPDYDDVLDHPDTDAVYLALPNGLHRTWTERAAAAGVAVLCEKPLAPTGDDAVAMAEACADAGVLLAEAWMTPFGTRWQALRASLDGADITTIDARFTFRIGPEAATNYRWRRDQGGGALLDVGIYTTGLAAELLGAGELEVVSSRAGADDRHGDGVDAWSRAELRSPSGAGVSIWCSFVDDEAQLLEIRTVDGRTISTSGAAFTQQPDGAAEVDPYQAMVEAFADAVANRAPWPRPVGVAIEHLRLLDRIAEARVWVDDA